MNGDKKTNIAVKIGRFVKKYFTFFLVLFIFLFLFMCDSVFEGKGIIADLRTISTSFTPTTDLFDDGSEVSFVSYFFGMTSNGGIKVEQSNFCYPTREHNVSTSDDFLCYKYNGVVLSVSNGVVCSIG